MTEFTHHTLRYSLQDCNLSRPIVIIVYSEMRREHVDG